MARVSVGKARWAALRGDYAAAGDLYRLAGDLSRALKMYQKGRQHRSAGEIAAQLGDHVTASRELEIGGQFVEAGEMALRSGDRERAARMFVAGGLPRRAAEIHEQSGRAGAAAALFDHAGDPKRAARLFLEAREPDKAARGLEVLFKAGPSPADLKELLGLAARCGQQFLAMGAPEQGARWLERAGRSREAARAWERASKPERAIRAYMAAGEPDRAAAVADAHPPDALDPALAAEAFRAACRWAEAAALYLESGRPGDAATCLEQLGCSAEAAWAHEAAGDFLGAATALERAGDHGDAADFYKKSGSMRDAARCYEAAGNLEEAAPRYLDAGDRLAAAEIYERLGEIDTAIAVLQAASSDNEIGGQVAARMGRLFERKGLDSLAVDQYRRAVADQAPSATNLEIWYRLASALERTGRVREAIATFRRVIAIEYNYRDATRRLSRLEERAAQIVSVRRSPLGDRYKIEAELSLGLVGRAQVAWDGVMDRKVLLRRFSNELIPPGPAADRLLNDARRVAQLHHPVIAAVHDAGQDDEGVYLIEEFTPGASLAELIKRDGPLDIPRAVQVITRLAEALDYAHGLGLLARSLRPETVLLSPSGDARLIDFGLGLRHTDAGDASQVYRPPEARLGQRMDPSSDVYLLGVVAWEMLFGFPPPVPDPEQKSAPVMPERDDRPLPDVLRRTLSECLVPDRTLRLGSAQKLLEELHGTHLLPGALMANRYEILREIGRGGMGTVFAARDLVLDEPVALKVLAGPLDENQEKRFIQEIRLTRQINHPNIVRVHTFERWRELRFIVMEYIDGVDLRRWAEARRPIPLGRSLEIVAGVAAGLAAAHRLGIVHRDVKPENVLLDGEGRPRLVDFGIARQGDVHLTREGLVMGSPAYMAPEQIRGQAADQRADLYALGVLTYFLIAGREPFSSENVAEVLHQQVETPPPPLAQFRPNVPPMVQAMVERVLAKDPNRRPASVFAFLEELTAARAELTVVTA
ncbi:MAG: protein kinase [Acidobacteriota bacterium]